jgi:hypothetical protein
MLIITFAHALKITGWRNVARVLVAIGAYVVETMDNFLMKFNNRPSYWALAFKKTVCHCPPFLSFGHSHSPKGKEKGQVGNNPARHAHRYQEPRSKREVSSQKPNPHVHPQPRILWILT